MGESSYIDATVLRDADDSEGFASVVDGVQYSHQYDKWNAMDPRKSAARLLRKCVLPERKYLNEKDQEKYPNGSSMFGYCFRISDYVIRKDPRSCIYTARLAK